MNKVIHFEVPFDDQERAKKFYSEVFGWQLMDMPEMNYVVARTAPTDDENMLKEPGAINGGMYERDGKSADHPVIVIGVDSIDEHVEQIAEAGGSVHRPKATVGDMGFYAQVKDTEGNIIGIWEDNKKQE